jgi:FkbM family methyltransferase
MRHGRIWAAEPVPATFAYLERNIHANEMQFSSVEIHTLPYAMADAEASLPMLVMEESTGWSRLVDEQFASAETRPIVRVQTKTLDSVLPPVTVDLLKVDVEGAELRVYRGAPQTLHRVRRVVMEYHSPELFRDCRHLLEGCGLRMVLRTTDEALGIAFFSR